MHKKFYGVLLAIFLLVSPVGADELSDANTLFDWAEQTFPQFFSPSGAETFTIVGYTARYYSETQVYVGVKDGGVYVYSEPVFGGLVYVGTLEELLAIANPQQQTAVDLTGSWQGTASSSPFPGCSAQIALTLQQSGSSFTGSGTATSNCVGLMSGTISGSIDGNSISYGIAYDSGDTITYTGTISQDQNSINGDYSWPAEDDHGTWSLQRQ